MPWLYQDQPVVLLEVRGDRVLFRIEGRAEVITLLADPTTGVPRGFRYNYDWQAANPIYTEDPADPILDTEV